MTAGGTAPGGPRRLPRRRFATVCVAAALALTGCGYDPSTAGGQDPPQGSAPSVGDADVAEQRAAHLVADAEELLRATEHVQADDAVSGDVKSVAGELTRILSMQTGRLDSDGGASAVVDEELQSVLGASGERAEAAYGDLLRAHVPRLQSSWSNLVEAGDPEVADVARQSSRWLEELGPRVEAMPGR